MEEKTNNIIGTQSLTRWRTMILLKQGLDYMVSSGKPKFKQEIEKDRKRLSQYLGQCVSNK